MKSVLMISVDVNVTRVLKAGCGTEKWMAISRELSGFNEALSGWLAPMFFFVGRDHRMGDFFSTSDPTLIGVTKSVRRAPQIWRMFESSGEMLPIEVEGYGEAFLLRVISNATAIDLGRSTIRRLPDGSVLIYRPVVRLQDLPAEGILRLCDDPMRVLLVEDDTKRIFRAEYAKCGLTGLRFEKLDVTK